MRVKRGFKARRRRNQVLKQAKGFRGRRKNTYRRAVEAVERGMHQSTRDRWQKKRSFRRLWIVRINAAARQNGISYSRLISGMKKIDCIIDRKVLADIALFDPKGFAAIVEAARG